MKKLLLLLMAWLVSGALMAQKVEIKKEAKHVLALHGGPAVPLGNFGSTTLSPSGSLVANKDAGFATTGFNVALTWGYKITNPVGVTAALFYNNHGVKNSAIQKEMETQLDVPSGTLNGLKLDHWQWYGISAGPMYSEKLSNAVDVNIRVMGGLANVNSPRIKLDPILVIKEDWSVTPLFRGAVDFQFNLGGNLYLFTGADYLYMKPKFTLETTIENQTLSETAKQNMAVVNLTAGVAIKF